MSRFFNTLLGAPLYVLFAFAVEIVEHVRQVNRTISLLRIKTREQLAAYVGGLQRSERSPILGWYLASVVQRGPEPFDKFAAREHLSSTLAIEELLKKVGIEIDGRDALKQFDTSTRETLWDSLRSWRSGDQNTVGARRLRRNEATQIEWLARLRQQEIRSWFISIDASLRQALMFVEGGKYAGFVLTPTAWAHRLADLHWGEMNLGGFSELMWSLPERTAGERMQTMMIRRVIEEAPPNLAIEPEHIRDLVEQFFLRGNYAQSVESIDDPVEQEANLNDVLEQVMPLGVSQVLDELVRRQSKR